MADERNELVELFFGARAQIVVGATLVVGSAIGWPVTALTVFKDEPQGILGLSWAAILVTGWGVLVGALTLRKTEKVETAVIENIEQADNVEVKV